MKNLELLEKRVAELESELKKVIDVLVEEKILEEKKGKNDAGPKETPKKT